MGHDQKRSYLEAIWRRYKKSSRKQKAKILDEFCAVCGYNRKYAIRLLKKGLIKKRKKPGKKPRYEAEKLLTPLQTIWLATDQMCSKKLKAALPAWLPYYEQEQGLLGDEWRG